MPLHFDAEFRALREHFLACEFNLLRKRMHANWFRRLTRRRWRRDWFHSARSACVVVIRVRPPIVRIRRRLRRMRSAIIRALRLSGAILLAPTTTAATTTASTATTATLRPRRLTAAFTRLILIFRITTLLVFALHARKRLRHALFVFIDVWKIIESARENDRGGISSSRLATTTTTATASTLTVTGSIAAVLGV